MVESDPLVLPAEAAGEAKTYVRAVNGEDDALISALIGAAADACEGYTRRLLLSRGVRETARAGDTWLRLSRTPVRAVTGLEAVAADGGATPLPPADYAIDIDANGDGWVRMTGGPPRRVRVSYEAGLATAWAELPDALRHGIVRLAGHFYALRGDAAGRGPAPEPPASVSALWRPYRRLSLG
ncbi:MAG: hypothetical protein ACJ8DZ_13050 [Allosphingosinicella sp.]